MRQFLKSVLASMLGTFGALFLVGVLATSFFIATVTLFSGAKVRPVSEASILYIPLDGVLVEKDDPFQLNFGQHFFGARARDQGLFDLQESLNLAAENDKIHGVFFHLNGLQAGLSMVTSLKKSIDEFKETSGKPVYGYADSLNSYEAYLATSFDRLDINKFVLAQINGVSFTFSFFKGSLEKLGIDVLTFREGEYKSALETFTRSDMSQKARENMEEVGKHLWEELAQAHSQRWGLSRTELDQKVSGLEFYQPQALLEYEGVSTAASVEGAKSRWASQLTAEKELSKELKFVPYQRFLLASMQGSIALRADTVAVVLAEGEIVDRGAASSGIVGNKWAEELRKVCKEKTVKAVVLRINSPGGSAQAADIMDDQVKACADKKVVYASFSDMAASGGYYMAARAHKIFAEPTTITGSIGVFSLAFHIKDFFEQKLGVSFDTVKTHTYADFGSPGRRLSPEESERIQQMVSHVYTRFLELVVDGRGFTSVEELKPYAGGKIWSGRGAYEVGLVDELGGLQETIAAAAEAAELDRYVVEFFPKPSNPFEAVLKDMGLSVLSQVGLYEAYSLVQEVRDRGAVQQLYMRLPWDLEFAGAR